MQFALSFKFLTFAASSVGDGVLTLLQKEGRHAKEERFDELSLHWKLGLLLVQKIMNETAHAIAIYLPDQP